MIHKVYEPSIRAHLGTAAHFSEVVVLKLIHPTLNQSVYRHQEPPFRQYTISNLEYTISDPQYTISNPNPENVQGSIHRLYITKDTAVYHQVYNAAEYAALAPSYREPSFGQ